MVGHNYNKNNDEIASEKVPFYKNATFLTFVGILLIFILPLCMMLMKSSKQSKKVSKAEAKIIEREVSPHKFSELRIAPKTSYIKDGEVFNFVISRDIIFTGNMTDVHLLVKVPDDVPNRQKIYNYKVSPAPRRYLDKSDGRYAEILLPSPHGMINVSIKGQAAVKTYNLNIAQKLRRNIDGILNEEDRESYLKEEEGLETKSRFVNIIANTHIPTATNDVDTVKNVFDYVVNRLRYDRMDINKDKGALAALHSGSGVCEEFAKAFVALCRVKNIPARIVTGFDIPFEDTLKDSYTGHTWAEVYFPEYGWVTFDPTNTLPESIRKEAENLKISPYDLVYGIMKNKHYLIIDARMVAAKYEGSGGMSSKNLVIQYFK
ncbi:MAG: transglutaminase-like domain-containing protein [Candidatus Gastranaerophilales bacterium]|nr:transglutaminase-like domain-containing protein [Candidatus Gastranaerophilales bacterium]